MSDPALPSSLRFDGKLENFGFVKSPAKPVSKTLKTGNGLSPAEQPTGLLKRKSTDDTPAPSRNSKRTAGKGSILPVQAPVPSPTKSGSRYRRKPSSKGHTSLDKYASHPNNLRDSIPPNLYLIFIGVNPGLTTALTGHAYAHPSNLFWRLLYSSGITPILHKPSDTYKLPSLYNIGNTNIVSRATKDASELSKEEMNAGVAILEQKISKSRPEAVCLVGKSIWEAIWRVKKGRAIRKEEFKYGWQAETHNMGIVKGNNAWGGARVFVGTTTSGLAASMRKDEKERIWRELGVWVEAKRKEGKGRNAGQEDGEKKDGDDDDDDEEEGEEEEGEATSV
jgi:G:T/U-mismatch repair DNA glycosylase